MNVPEAVLTAMRETNALFDSEVGTRHNVQALDRVYTKDATILPPGAEMVRGREPIKEFWRQAIESMGVTSTKLGTVSAEATGESVFEIGKADLTLGNGQIVAVKYVVLWKQEDGTWKWHMDIWNGNQ
jgi:ketosteroid isomerase-like protein